MVFINSSCNLSWIVFQKTENVKIILQFFLFFCSSIFLFRLFSYFYFILFHLSYVSLSCFSICPLFLYHSFAFVLVFSYHSIRLYCLLSCFPILLFHFSFVSLSFFTQSHFIYGNFSSKTKILLNLHWAKFQTRLILIWQNKVVAFKMFELASF